MVVILQIPHIIQPLGNKERAGSLDIPGEMGIIRFRPA